MQTINKHKIKSPHIPLLMLLLTFLSISIPTLTVHASSSSNVTLQQDPSGGGGGTTANAGGDGNSGGTAEGSGGATESKCGFRMYVVNEKGLLVSKVIDLVCAEPQYDLIYASTRIGGGAVSESNIFNMPAGMPKPFIHNGTSFQGNGQAVREWMLSSNASGEPNISRLIYEYLGENVYNAFINTTNSFYLILEPITWHNVFLTSSADSNTGIGFYGTFYNWLQLYNQSGLSDGGFTAQLDNYILGHSLLLERDQPNLNLTLPTSGGLIDLSNLGTQGYGMHIYWNKNDGTHTWDSENHPTDEAPAPEPPVPTSSTPPSPTAYQYTIIKSYRLKDESGNLIDKGTYTRTNTVATILIEDEPLNTTDKNYKVIGWKTSTNTNYGISSLTWESSVPQAIGTTGTTPTTTTLTSHYKVLYVLLEAQLTEPLIANYNYILPQSSITRRISYSNPDFTNTNMTQKISTHRFVFMLPAHNPIACPGHTWTHEDDDPACTNSHTESGDCNCTALVGHDSDCGIYDEWEECDGHTYTCIDFQFTDDSLLFGIKNSLATNYPSILASNWSFEIPVGDPSPTEKNISINRNNPYHYAYNKYFNAYGVIMRGDDKLSLAEWKNTNASLAANTKLPTASSVQFRVSNTQNGTRQTTDYTKTFNANFISDILDPDTTYEATSYTGNETPTGSLCGSTVSIASASSLAYNSVGVNVKVYSGSATSTSVNTATPSNIVLTSGNKIESGSAVSSGQISFIPYIEMKYDINTTAQTVPYTAYVLGEHTRSLNFNSYAGVTTVKFII